MIRRPMAAEDVEQIPLKWGGRQVVAELRRTDRRVLRIDVQPTGQVVVFAPRGEALDVVQARLTDKRGWIFREIDRIDARPSVTPARRYVSGETHLLLGRQYRLSIEQGNDPRVVIEGTRLNIVARRTDDQAHYRRLLTAFYARTAREVFKERLEAMLPPFTRKGLGRPQLVVRGMVKRWGSYTPSGRIALNVDLIRACPMLIDYVICHELIHAFHPDHGAGWREMFSTLMPDWEARKARLEALLR